MFVRSSLTKRLWSIFNTIQHKRFYSESRSESCWCRIHSWTLPTANYDQLSSPRDLCSCHLWVPFYCPEASFLHVGLCKSNYVAFCHCSCHRHIALGGNPVVTRVEFIKSTSKPQNTFAIFYFFLHCHSVAAGMRVCPGSARPVNGLYQKFRI